MDPNRNDPSRGPNKPGDDKNPRRSFWLPLIIAVIAMIVIGSIFSRSRDLLWDAAKKEIEKETLQLSASCCKVVPAVLGEQIGDYAAIAAALS